MLFQTLQPAVSDHVADGQVVGFALECVDACTVLLEENALLVGGDDCLLYTSPSPRD